MNQICIMKNSKDLLEYTQPMSLSSNNSRNTLIITKAISETDIIKMLDIPIESIFVMLGGCFFSTDNRYSYGYQLCSFSRLLVHLFV